MRAPRHPLPLSVLGLIPCAALSACGPPVADPDPLARLPPADSADPGPAELSDGLELGEVAPCAAPAPLGWSDAAPRGAAPFAAGDHFGALALLERGGERLVLHSEGDAIVAWAAVR